MIEQEMSPEVTAWIVEHCPNSRVEVFGGHMMFWDYPERFTAVLGEFLNGAG